MAWGCAAGTGSRTGRGSSGVTWARGRRCGARSHAAWASDTPPTWRWGQHRPPSAVLVALGPRGPACAVGGVTAEGYAPRGQQGRRRPWGRQERQRQLGTGWEAEGQGPPRAHAQQRSCWGAARPRGRPSGRGPTPPGHGGGAASRGLYVSVVVFVRAPHGPGGVVGVADGPVEHENLKKRSRSMRDLSENALSRHDRHQGICASSSDICASAAKAQQYLAGAPTRRKSAMTTSNRL